MELLGLGELGGEKRGRLGRPAPFCFAHLLQVDSLDCHEVAGQLDFTAQQGSGEVF